MRGFSLTVQVYAAYFFASLFYALGLAQVKGKKLSPLSLPSWLSGLLNLNQARAFHQVRVQLILRCGGKIQKFGLI
jgi:hypothetical protein